MSSDIDTIIVGAGLAGACAAFHLSQQEKVQVLEAHHPAAGASGAAAGLVNPLMGLRARPTWRVDEALQALQDTLFAAEALPLYNQSGILRPAADGAQAATFHDVATTYPSYASWIPPEDAIARYPDVALPDGALWIRQGGTISVPAFVDALLAAACRNGASLITGTRVTGWGEDSIRAYVDVTQDHDTERRYAHRVLLALGHGYLRHPELSTLNLHAVKGQTVRVTKPDGVGPFPPLSGQGYVVPEGETLVIGSSYERDFTDVLPSDYQTNLLHKKATRMLPALAQVTVLEATAGVRVNVPGTRLPMVGPLPGCSRVWVFTGLGSKGLLMAPMLARRLTLFFEQPLRIDRAIKVKLAG